MLSAFTKLVNDFLVNFYEMSSVYLSFLPGLLDKWRVKEGGAAAQAVTIRVISKILSDCGTVGDV